MPLRRAGEAHRPGSDKSCQGKYLEQLAVALHQKGSLRKAAKGETTMDGDYVFLCGVMWCAYGQQDAGRELLRAANSADPDLSALAVAMLAQQPRSFQATEA